MTKPTAEEERAAVVAWLRLAAKRINDFVTETKMTESIAFMAAIEAYEKAAEAIERGDHHKGKD